ncbi:hypothetical protein MPDQ_005228 [Monascus purpureus]|uniref:Uncharacterized protein n=1 Tax=Monascus purpureus TaxID=5098 RepID=A0A507QWQ5_MONPU|nr:hypothetical protein MPDQ_005228 [Monascus purpureus]BDD63452.1 hypothetical protein MAP00_008337 [Monascus purpureus]
MLASKPVFMNLRAVSSSKPQVTHPELVRQSIAASDGCSNLSERTLSPSSRGSTTQRYTTQVTDRTLRTPSPLGNGMHTYILSEEGRDWNTTAAATNVTVRFPWQRVAQLSYISDTATDPRDSSDYDGGTPTPVDDTPYIRFAISQLTREDSDDADERGGWNEGLDYPVRPAASAQQLLLQRPAQRSAEAEMSVVVDPQKYSVVSCSATSSTNGTRVTRVIKTLAARGISWLNSFRKSRRPSLPSAL